MGGLAIGLRLNEARRQDSPTRPHTAAYVLSSGFPALFRPFDEVPGSVSSRYRRNGGVLDWVPDRPNNPKRHGGERAFYGQAACRARLGNPDQARREVGDYLRRFPHGKHRADPERYLQESVVQIQAP